MGRPLFAIVLGYLVFGVPGLALFRLAGVDPHGVVATGFLLFSIGYGIVFALLAGYVTAWIARRDVLWPVLTVAALVAMVAAASLAANLRSGPIWSPLAALLLMAPAVVLGGALQIPEPPVIQLGDIVAADIAALPELLEQLGYPSDPDAIAARIGRIGDAGGRVLVARDDDDDYAVLGVIALDFLALLHHDDDLCRITALVVAERARGRGVGRRLVAAAEHIAREHRCLRIEVTSAEHRAAAHAFYLALGYDEKRKRFLKYLE